MAIWRRSSAFAALDEDAMAAARPQHRQHRRHVEAVAFVVDRDDGGLAHVRIAVAHRGLAADVERVGGRVGEHAVMIGQPP